MHLILQLSNRLEDSQKLLKDLSGYLQTIYPYLLICFSIFLSWLEDSAAH